MRCALLPLAAGVFCFFLLVTVPKIGFATLIQTLAASAGFEGRIFGFAGCMVMMVDGLLITVLAFVAPPYVSLETSLWVSCGTFAAAGIFEGCVGPSLVLTKESRRLITQGSASQQHLESWAAATE